MIAAQYGRVSGDLGRRRRSAPAGRTRAADTVPGRVNSFPILVDAITKLAASATPEHAARAVLEACIELTEAESGRVYLLSLATGSYQSVATIGRPVEHTFALPPDPTAADAKQPLEQAVLTASPVVVNAKPESGYWWSSRLVVPAVRAGRTCVGVVDLRSRTHGHFDDRATDDVISIAQLLDMVFERRFALRHVQSGFASVHYDQGETQFYEDVLLYAATASQMEYVTLRELTHVGTLRTLGTWGYPEGTNDRAFDILDLSELPGFEWVVKTEAALVGSDAERPEFAGLRSDTLPRHARGIVVAPVLVGGSLYGVVSFGARMPFDFSETEVASFQTVANTVGVMLDHYRIFHGSVMRAATSSSMAIAMTGVEIAQIARHEARNGIDRIQLALSDIDRYLARATTPKAEELHRYVDDVDTAAGEIVTALDKIRVGTAPLRSDFRRTSVYELWTSVQQTCDYRLRSLGITVRYDGPPLPIHVAPDWFRQVFYNLVLNSMDAFERGRRARGTREAGRIVLVVSRPLEKAQYVPLTYSDNAGGINPASLRSTDGAAVEEAIEQAVFAPNVTSKENGSGWGLTLVRNILLQYGASIDLIEHRRGVSFKITLPRTVLAGDH
jgi:nitrogen-specific signal transduction histidine kinase/GAF domain-containing protein